MHIIGYDIFSISFYHLQHSYFIKLMNEEVSWNLKKLVLMRYDFIWKLRAHCPFCYDVRCSVPFRYLLMWLQLKQEVLNHYLQICSLWLSDSVSTGWKWVSFDLQINNLKKRNFDSVYGYTYARASLGDAIITLFQ